PDMIVVLSDTHRSEGHGLSSVVLDAVREATAVVHAGDFTTTAVVDAFEALTDRLVAVHGNVDGGAVRERLPAERIEEIAGLRLAVVHGHEHTTVARSLLGREADADLVISGHSHRAAVADARGVTLLNPGSHADPRGGTATFATLDLTGPAGEDGGIDGTIRTVDGTVLERFSVPVGERRD
ncbi:MAG: metallophosphoesterase, partial [Halobacteriales archaeon]|nr:metallophosphoesterase [Halobacteriales archaeon]